MKPTPEAMRRAEKIVNTLFQSDPNFNEIERIAAEIDGAIAENNKLNCSKCTNLGYVSGKAQAYEDAAKIAGAAKIDTNCVTTGQICNVIADTIRARSKAETGLQ